VLIVGQRDSFAHILAANIQCWGHEVMVLPSGKVMCVEGDVLLYDLDESLRISTLTRGRDMPTLNMSLPSGFAGEDVKSCREQLPRARLTIALSSFSVSRTTLECIGAVALLQKPFEMSRLQHYLRVLRGLLLEGEETQQPGDKLRILVVDDDVTIANVVRDILNFESRYEVAVAYDGLEALEQSFRWKPHCIVTDLIMPWMNGYQVIHCLAASSLQKKPSFVIMSALAQLEVPVNRSYLRGKVMAYVNKPFSIDHLLAAIEQVCMESV
jgi:CheY-like chemotaxis protein